MDTQASHVGSVLLCGSFPGWLSRVSQESLGSCSPSWTPSALSASVDLLARSAVNQEMVLEHLTCKGLCKLHVEETLTFS